MQSERGRGTTMIFQFAVHMEKAEKNKKNLAERSRKFKMLDRKMKKSKAKLQL